ncbi:GNAT family N-acetyltransferase [Chryseosolibacter indicus]|uniref:GNAT family N-acetyltransferase n=1 Tax=Chryseosolibacter indicus TaxID=2782351 RepID=A0ABS5VN28_9BACT|nr:GNAT family N-acetyltransferase [Chryseosolibacter indicus]MBT1702849.1 GNAT family N-acetyltransferase [Chryseosolibacter indicus]
MTSISRATERDCNSIVAIGKSSVAESHRGSCSEEEMQAFLERNYNSNAIREELSDINNIYHIIHYKDNPAGFSKIILNAKHPNIAEENITKLDRIYLLKDFYGLKLGLELLNFNIELSKNNNQSGMWLYTWVGNNRAIDFYLKAGFTSIGSHKFYVNETHFDLCHQMFLKFS